MRWPLQFQILLALVGMMLATLVAVTAVNVQLSVARTRDRIEQQIRDVARTLSTSSFPLTEPVLVQMRGLSGANYVVTDMSGNPLASSDERLPADTLPLESVERWQDIRLGEPVLTESGSYLHSALRIRRRNPAFRDLVLHVLYPETTYTHAWREAAFPPLLVGGIAVGLAVLMAVIIASRVSGPLRRLRDHVGQIGSGNFEPIELPRRNDEVQDLARAINDMTQTLAEYEDRVRRTEQLRTLGQIGGGLAHQLRNSVTGCLLALDLHRTLGDEESLEVAIRQLRFMERYIRRFLPHRAKDARPSERVNLAEIIEQALPLLEPTARHVGVPITWSPPSEVVFVEGDADDLEQLLINLVLNAVDAAQQVAPQDGANPRVELSLTSTGTEVDIHIADSGPGPEGDVEDTMHEPLVTNKADGTGLGLFIAHEIAGRHGGRIHWNRQDNMTVFHVILPQHAKAEPMRTHA